MAAHVMFVVDLVTREWVCFLMFAPRTHYFTDVAHNCCFLCEFCSTGWARHNKLN
jgi:hypothetical protein